MAEKTYRILVINPGSTSTKVGVFDGETEVFTKNVAHEAEKLAEFTSVSDQMPYRRDMILAALAENDVDLASVDAFVGRGGGLLSLEGGTYAVNEVMLDHAYRGANGIQHPAQLGSQLANEFAQQAGKPAFVVNPPDTDEFCDLARMTGIKGVYRNAHLHALNLKETAIRHAHGMGKRYDECDFIVCHIGGGVSISAHRHGKMIDGYDIVQGEGAMAPTRCGAVPVAGVLDYLEAGHSIAEARALCMKIGGFVDLLGTSDAIEVCNRAASGDVAAQRAWDAMLYQLNKYIGSMATVLGGHVDGILLGGGMVHNKDLVKSIEDNCGWIAPVSAYPGEFELEAMAAGAIRVLDGEEEPKVYTGVPVFQGFDN
ncbi:MAG: butyrate kinase [Atopobiaceae bacterium]|nr:butyrate kinase [Atopobiaceae bacterium]